MIPRVVCLGLGWIGRRRLEALAASGLVEIAGVADVDGAALVAAAAIAPAAERGETLDDLLALEPDGVVIATPSAQHAREAMRALDRGCAVFCQKPLARNGDEAADVVATARARDRLLGVDLSFRHLQATTRISELIASGGLGDLVAVDLTFHNAYGPDHAWYADRTQAGRGCLLDLGSHLVDLLALWTGEVPFLVRAASLSCAGRPWTPGTGGVEDAAFIHLESMAGVVARLACSWATPSGRDAVIEARLFGTRAGAALRNVSGSFHDFSAEYLERGLARMLAWPPDDWSGRAALAWAAALGSGARFDPAAQRFVDRSRLLDRCYAAASRRGDGVAAIAHEPAGRHG